MLTTVRPNPDPAPPMEKRDPWFDDGNIVISCEGTAMFRVHASVLARHSEVFRNLFADAEPCTTGNNTSRSIVEDCPVVELSDTPEDCQHLMGALYGPVSFDVGSMDCFIYLSSLLQSATKYCIDWLRAKAIRHLRSAHPDTLQALFSANSKAWVPHPALVINLARKVDVPIVLPIALYRLGACSMARALEPEVNRSTGLPDSAYLLSLEDMHNYMRYQEQRRNLAYLLSSFLNRFKPDSTCDDLHFGTCSKGLGIVTSKVQHASIELHGTRLKFAPLGLLRLASQIVEAHKEICPSCQRRLLVILEERRQVLWKELPSWFHLPQWDVLRAD